MSILSKYGLCGYLKKLEGPRTAMVPSPSDDLLRHNFYHGITRILGPLLAFEGLPHSYHDGVTPRRLWPEIPAAIPPRTKVLGSVAAPHHRGNLAVWSGDRYIEPKLDVGLPRDHLHLDWQTRPDPPRQRPESQIARHGPRRAGAAAWGGRWADEAGIAPTPTRAGSESQRHERDDDADWISHDFLQKRMRGREPRWFQAPQMTTAQRMRRMFRHPAPQSRSRTA